MKKLMFKILQLITKILLSSMLLITPREICSKQRDKTKLKVTTSPPQKLLRKSCTPTSVQSSVWSWPRIELIAVLSEPYSLKVLAAHLITAKKITLNSSPMLPNQFSMPDKHLKKVN